MRFLKIRHYLFAALLFAMSAAFCTAQDYVKEERASYITIQVPGALGTYPMSLNKSMAVTGYYLTSPSSADGFLRDAEGIITTFRVGGSIWTEPESINAAGEITGFYEVLAGVPRGFLRYANGRIITFDPPCVVCIPSPQAQPVAINDFGEIAGNYPFPLASARGFRRSAGGIISQVSIAGFELGADYSAYVTALNASGTIVGYVPFYSESFLTHPDGFTTWFSAPVEGEDLSFCGRSTIAEAVTSEGVIAGWYSASTGPGNNRCATKLIGGFVRSPQGNFTLFSPPGTIVISPESGFVIEGGTPSAPHRISLNEGGVITGSYTDASQVQHGFVRETDGVITSFDPPRSTQTTATSINDYGAIAGSYDWSDPVPVGFLRIPIP